MPTFINLHLFTLKCTCCLESILLLILLELFHYFSEDFLEVNSYIVVKLKISMLISGPGSQKGIFLSVWLSYALYTLSGQFVLVQLK